MHPDSPVLLEATLHGEWRHRGCIVGLDPGRSKGPSPYAVRHASGLPMGRASSLKEARQLIDEEIALVRQRLAAAA
ncbi:MAG: hypothetical protein VKP70_07150 [Cyanobacteriota bacterium]|nr:hypothetical protein [Cyanobacteriota bacterium]